MANNVDVTPGTGATFKTTDTAGVHTGHVNVDSSALPTGAATAAAQATLETDVEAVLAKLSADPATQTTLAAILAKIIAAPATEAKQDTLIAKDFATQTTLAAVLAKIIAAPSTEAKQDSAITQLTTAVAHLSDVVTATQNTEGTSGNVEDGIDELKVLVGPVDAAAEDDPDAASASLVALARGIIQVIVSASAESTVAMEPQAYETVAASQDDQVLGTTGASGDYLSHVLIIPATTSPGAVSIKDGAGSDIIIFPGGTDSVGSLVPFVVPINARSAAGAWSMSTGANVSGIGFGTFTA